MVAILGSTFDGSYEPVKEIAEALDRLESEEGIHIPVHVDGASGGLRGPFLAPDLEWDFRLKRVQSINASGHKYGLVYPGVGWAIWRDEGALPRELVFNVNYLGGNMPTFALNFSRPGSEVVAQYFMFMSLGREGYTAMMRTLQKIALHISQTVAEMGPYRLISDGSELPVFAFAIKPEVKNYTVFDVSDRLRERGWLVPAYTLPGEPPGPQRAAGRRARRHAQGDGRRAARRAGRQDQAAGVAVRAATRAWPAPRRRSRTRAPAAPHSTSASDLPAASSCLSVDASMTRSRSRMRAPIASSSRVPTTA